MISLADSLVETASRPLSNGAYGSSKAALNYFTRKIHYENHKLCAFPIDLAKVNFP